MAENLDKIIKIDGADYNINAVYSDEAGKVVSQLTIIESSNSNNSFNFDGSSSYTINYVPADRGGKFSAPVYIDSDYVNDGKSVVTLSQMNDRVAALKGTPVGEWNPANSYPLNFIVNNIDNKEEIRNLTTITGTRQDFEVFKRVLGIPNPAATTKPSAYFGIKIGQSGAVCSVGGFNNEGNATAEYKNVIIPYVGFISYKANGVDGIADSPSNGSTDDNDYCSILLDTGRPVTKIHDDAFNKDYTGNAGIDNIESILIPDSITEIGDRAFRGCENLTSLVIPNSVESIGNNLFSGCSKLKNVTIGNKITAIPYNAFYGCSNLESIVIPKSVTVIDHDAFNGCDSLNTINYTGSEEDWDKIEIDDTNSAITKDKIIFGYSAPVPSNIISLKEVVDNPILYVCRDVTAATIGDSSMFFKLPGSAYITEVSSLSTKLWSSDKQHSYTYEGLAEIIAKINNRLDGIGLKVGDEKVTLATVHTVDAINAMVPDVEITDSFDPSSVPTIKELHDEIEAIKGGDGDSLAKLREDLTALTEEVCYELESGSNGEGIAIDYANSRIDKIERGDVSLAKVKVGQYTLTPDILQKLIRLVDTIDWNEA